MDKVTIKNRSFDVPILIPSVSSFETQLAPVDALSLQCLLREPISLVSAFDIHNETDALTAACRRFREGGVLLLDSGGYEASRTRKYTKQETWNIEKYREICRIDGIYDLVFSFDFFIGKDEDFQKFLNVYIGEMHLHADYVEANCLIPVFHVQSYSGDRYLSHDEVLTAVERVSRELDPPFIAIPERELGPGLMQRVRLARKIVKCLKKVGNKARFHVLGCGNLLSFAYFASAGVTMCDGLEWCRTLTAENFHLHHYQQRDAFDPVRALVHNPDSEFLLSQLTDNYNAHVAGRNLVGLQSFHTVLHGHLAGVTLSDFLRTNFGKPAADALGI